MNRRIIPPARPSADRPAPKPAGQLCPPAEDFRAAFGHALQTVRGGREEAEEHVAQVGHLEVAVVIRRRFS
jgi:hypothetical protein